MKSNDIPWDRLDKQPRWVGQLVMELDSKLDCATRQLRALRKAPPVEPDVPPPSSSEFGRLLLSTGWVYWIGSSGVINTSRACSSSIGHNPRSDRDTNTQGKRWLYSTKALALKAARYELETRYLQTAAKIEELIEREEGAES